MPMPFRPGPEWYISFQQFDPSTDRQCIYYTQYGRRCLWPADDNYRAIELRRLITTLPYGTDTLNLLLEYILCSCCMSGRAKHRLRIEDRLELLPLAERWLHESQTRYNLRSGNFNNPTESISSLALIYQAPQSEFAPHVTSPGPGDSVSQKLLEFLVDDDFRTGSLYIFNRDSSPGHVKIGYTSWSVAGRLEQWSNCGYAPNLLFNVGNVPYVRRAETLAHHELIKEWRRERRCNHGRGCASAHQEWFEISIEQSSKVLGDWADFMKRAEPYDVTGRLKPQWVKFAELSDAMQETVTVKKLLEHYEASLVNAKNLREKLAALELMPKVEEKESACIESNVGDFKPAPFSGTLSSSKLDAPLKSNLPQRLAPLPEGDSLFRSELSVKTNASNEASNAKEILVKEVISPEQTPLSPSPLLQPTAYADDESFVKEIGETSSATIKEIIVKEVMSSEQIPLPPSPLLQPIAYTNAGFSVGEIGETSSATIKEIIVKKDMSPEQIPLPPSPLLQPTAYAADESFAEEMRETSSATTKGNGLEPGHDENHAVACIESKIETPILTSAPTDVVPQTPSPSLTQLSEELLNLGIHHKETGKTASSPSRCQQKATEQPQTDADTEISNGDDTIVADEEDESWGDDLTLIAEDQTQSLELAPLKIVHELYNGIRTRELSSTSKGLNTVTVLETEAQVNVAVIA